MSGYRDYEHLEFDVPEEGILRMVLRNPGRLNAVSAEMHRELARIWRDVDGDPAVRVVLVTGADGVFSAGGEFSFIESLIDDWDRRQEAMKEVRDLVHGMVGCSKLVVSAVAGPAAGAAAAVALLADISIVTPDAKIIDGHTRFGIAAGDHAVIIWPLLCGMAKSKYYLLLSETLSGAEAERIGLVSMCVPEDDLQETALAMARRLVSMPQHAVRWTKQALNGWLRMAAPMYDISAAYENLGFSDPDVREGVAALREKRAPQVRSAESVNGRGLS